ncbi:MAG: permease of phosphate ABC transporter [Peptococcaceae bacterium]|nr:permease of phosphate ABC transporter [Peptococcaceae bacterium]
MVNLFDTADAWLAKSSWKDLALVKFCLFFMGILVALRLPKRTAPKVRKWARWGFVLTYVPLMAKYAYVVKKMPR